MCGMRTSSAFLRVCWVRYGVHVVFGVPKCSVRDSWCIWCCTPCARCVVCVCSVGYAGIFRVFSRAGLGKVRSVCRVRYAGHLQCFRPCGSRGCVRCCLFSLRVWVLVCGLGASPVVSSRRPHGVPVAVYYFSLRVRVITTRKRALRGFARTATFVGLALTQSARLLCAHSLAHLLTHSH